MSYRVVVYLFMLNIIIYLFVVYLIMLYITSIIQCVKWQYEYWVTSHVPIMWLTTVIFMHRCTEIMNHKHQAASDLGNPGVMSRIRANSVVTMLTSMIKRMWTETFMAQFETLSRDLHEGTEHRNENWNLSHDLPRTKQGHNSLTGMDYINSVWW